MRYGAGGFTLAEAHRVILTARAKEYVKVLKSFAADLELDITVSHRVVNNHIDAVIDSYSGVLLNASELDRRIASGRRTVEEALGSSARQINACELPLSSSARHFVQEAIRIYGAFWREGVIDPIRPTVAIQFTSQLLASEVLEAMRRNQGDEGASLSSR